MADFREVAKQKENDEKGIAVKIFDRQGKPYLAADKKTQCTITVIGSEAETYRKMRDEVQRKAAESSVDATEASAAARIETAARAVTAWSGWSSDGAEPECKFENVSVLLSVEHILLQVEAGIGRRSDFFADASLG